MGEAYHAIEYSLHYLTASTNAVVPFECFLIEFYAKSAGVTQVWIYIG